MKSSWRTRRKKGLKIRTGWKKILLVIYQRKSMGTESKRGKKRADFSLAPKFTNSSWFKELKGILKISDEELIHNLGFLKEQKLVEHNYYGVLLTGKGFDVAGKIEEQRETRLHRASSFLLSGVIAFTLLAALIHQMNIIPPDLLLWFYAIPVLVIGVFYFIVTSRI